MNRKIPLIMKFITVAPDRLDDNDANCDVFYDSARQVCVSAHGEVVWSLGRKPYTSCYTAGRTRPAGFNKNNKWVPKKYTPGRADRRSGK